MSAGDRRNLRVPPLPRLELLAPAQWHSIPTSAVEQWRGTLLAPSRLEFEPSYWGQALVREAWIPVEGLAELHHS
eukprot:98926-Amphidinium_carterae.1